MKFNDRKKSDLLDEVAAALRDVQEFNPHLQDEYAEGYQFAIRSRKSAKGQIDLFGGGETTAVAEPPSAPAPQAPVEWEPFGVSRYGTRRWRSLKTGRVVYQEEMPGAHEHHGESQPDPDELTAEQAMRNEGFEYAPSPAAEAQQLRTSPQPGLHKPHVALSHWLATRLGQLGDRGRLEAKELWEYADQIFGGTRAEGKYGPSDAYDALEAGFNKDLKTDPTLPLPQAIEEAESLAAMVNRLPTQTNRSGNKEAFQQFSTPPHYAYAVTWAANLKPGDVVLEPSAGTGSLAVHANNAGAEVHTNELDPRRADFLKDQFGEDRVHIENAEHISGILPGRGVKPNVVIMNPPFSQTAGRMGDKKQIMTGANHIEEALNMLEPGGRLVAIVGRGMSPDAPTFRDWFRRIGQENAIRANVGVNGDEYKKYGTHFDTRVLVIDKVAPHGETVTGDVDDIPSLMKTLAEVRDARPTDRGAPSEQAGERVPEGAERGTVPGDDPALETRAGASGEDAKQPEGLRAGDAGGDSERGRDADVRPGGDAGSGLGDVPSRAEAQPGPVAGAQAAPGRPLPEPARSGRGGKAKGKRGGKSARDKSVQQSVPFVSQLRPPERIAISVASPQEQKPKGKPGESLYDEYHPMLLRVEGWQPHPDPMVESAAMAGIRPPVPTYRPMLSPDLVTGKKIKVRQPDGTEQERNAGLSDVGLETVVYMGQANEGWLPPDDKGVVRRRWMLCGDLTGTGKGRVAAASIANIWNQGIKKHVFVSQKQDLFHKQLKRDWIDVGMDPSQLVHFDDIRNNPNPPKEGVVFITYDTLKGRDKKDPTAPSNLDKLIEWLGGENFEGFIAMDEAHTMGNAMDFDTGFGMSTASQASIAGMDLQRRLPKARGGYFSATPATEVRNLGYAERLGIWGPQTAFPNKTQFVNAMKDLAAMEAVAQSLKATGGLVSRSLSYDGVENHRLTHKLTDEQKFNYDVMSEAWQKILTKMDDAAEALAGGSAAASKGALRSAKAQIWATEQRFFNQVLTAMQMPTIIGHMKEQVAAGRAPVLHFVNHMDAATSRALAKRSEDQELEEIDLSPKEMIISFLETSFPIHKWEEYQDENGNARSRMVKDSEGNPVVDPKAQAIRDELVATINSMHIIPESPLDQIINAFGEDAVAEATGRKNRVIWGKGEHGERRKVQQSRPDAAAQADIDAFRDGKKHILLLSNKYATGFDFHADRNIKNQKQRVFYPAQPGWRADNAIQAMGRVNRTNQSSKPIYFLPEVEDIPGHKRFMTSIARRLEQLGSLGRGQRQTASSGLFKAEDNLETTQAEIALTRFWMDLRAGQIEGLKYEDTLKQLGLWKEPKEGSTLPPMPKPVITQFLNRLLVVSTGMQKRLWDEFDARHKSAVERAIKDGTLDQGVANYPAEKMVAKKPARVIHRDPVSGAEARHIHMTATKRTPKQSWENTAARPPLKWVYNSRSGRIWAMYQAADRTDEAGNVTQNYVLRGPTSSRHVESREMRGSAWEDVSPETAKRYWDEEFKAAPDTYEEDAHFVTGALLPIWDKLPEGGKVFRVHTEKGSRFAGKQIPAEHVEELYRNLGVQAEGAAETKQFDTASIHDALSKGFGGARLANGWRLKPVRIQGERRIQLVGPGPFHWKQLEGQGVFKEKRGSEYELFVPVGSGGLQVLEKIVEHQPIVEAEGAHQLGPRVKPKPEADDDAGAPVDTEQQDDTTDTAPAAPARAEPEVSELDDTPYISEEQREAIHSALKLLAGNDPDRARVRNDVGFNQLDTHFGGSLAAAAKLSDRQAHHGAKLLKKYHRQVPEDLMKRATTYAPPPPKADEPDEPPPFYAVTGNTYEHKDTIKSAATKVGGRARWNGDKKAWLIPSDAHQHVQHLKGLKFAPAYRMAYDALSDDADQDGFERLPELGFERLPDGFRLAHAPAGYTHARPLMIQGKAYIGGEFIPNSVMAKATPAEKAAVEGQPQADKTQTPQFKRWFGDWENDKANASKVINRETGQPQETHHIGDGTGSAVMRDGKPVVVYHGTARGGFNAFDKTKQSKESLYGPGFYFTEDRSVADEYQLKDRWTLTKPKGEVTAEIHRRLGKVKDEKMRALLAAAAKTPEQFHPGHWEQWGVKTDDLYQLNENAETKAVYLNIRKPFDLDERIGADGYKALGSPPGYGPNSSGESIYENLTTKGDSLGWGRARSKAAANMTLQRAGYDGITHIGGRVIAGGHDHRVWIAFEPNQIKSVDNQGSFDPNNHDIRLGFERLPDSYQFAVTHAPQGYTRQRPLVIQGKSFVGGEFIPSEVMARATPQERAAAMGQAQPQAPQPQPQQQEARPGVIVPPGNLGIARAQMPQIAGKDVPEFLEGLRAKGIEVRATEIPSGKLKATQAELSVEQMDTLLHKLPVEKLQSPVIVSNDGFILDGHHRWGALVRKDPNLNIKAHLVDMPIRELLKAAKAFDKVGYKDIGAKGSGLPSIDKAPKLREPKSREEMKEWLAEAKQHPYIAEAERRLKDTSADTEKKYKRPDGTWDEERVKTVHEPIINHFLNRDPQAAAKPGERPKAVLLIGPFGAGKTFAGTPIVKQLMPHYTLINPDEVKERMPEDQGWNATHIHEESSHISKQVQKRATEARHNLLFDGSGQNAEKMNRMADEYTAKGYDVHVVHVTVPSHISAYRAASRFLENPFGMADKDKRPSRYAPIDYVFEDVDSKPDRTYETLKQNKNVKSGVSFNTHRPYDQPVIELDRFNRGEDASSGHSPP